MTLGQTLTSQPQPSVSHSASHLDAEQCPWCDQLITRERFQQIRARIKQEEQERIAVVEAKLKAEASSQIAAKDLQLKVALDHAGRASAAALEKEKHESAAREARAVDEAQKLSASGMQELQNQLVVIQREKTALQTANGVAETRLQEAQALQRQQLEEHARAETKKLRETLEQVHAQNLNQKDAKAFDERQKLQLKIDELSRQLQRQTAEELGEGAEVDLYEDLRAAFEHDRIRRIQRGTPGADIWHDVVHHDEVCGRIVYDSKNRNIWRMEYVTKLHDDQRSAEAVHAVLATRKFPDGQQQFCMINNVIIANPARVIAIVGWLRKQIVEVHRLRLSAEERDGKIAELYSFINSEPCRRLFQRIEDVTNGMLELEVTEKTAHDRVWKQRGVHLKAVLKAHGDLQSQIDRIIEGDRNDEQRNDSCG